jgi:D-alanine-D-alanine ligase
MKKMTVALLFGGKSGEHEVSLQSAGSILKAMDHSRYNVVPIGITREGEWKAGPSFTKADFPVTLESGNTLFIPTRPSAHFTLQILSSDRTFGAPLQFDVVFPALHGTYGEDGTLQGLLEMGNIPYVGAGVLGSALGMDKDVTKRLLRDAGLPVVKFMTILDFEWHTRQADLFTMIESSIGFPCFVKPVNAGSSVGISKVRSLEELRPAIDLAVQYDRKVIIEEGIDAREIECSVLGNDEPLASLPGEIIPANEFYDYNAKYINEGSRLLIPASLTESETRTIRDYAVKTFLVTECAGMARVDFFIQKHSGMIYLNEINTIPGFTSISMYPKLWEATGVGYPELIDKLIQLAIERHRGRQTKKTISHL